MVDVALVRLPNSHNRSGTTHIVDVSHVTTKLPEHARENPGKRTGVTALQPVSLTL